MVLSNSERQARFRQRLKDAARRGVTPDMVRKATRLNFDQWAKDDCERVTWEDVLVSARKHGKQAYWTQWVPADVEDDYAEFGDDAPLMRAVAAVAHSILNPPKDVEA